MKTVEQLLKNFNANYQPRFFNSSDIENFLKMNENKLVIVLRLKENEKRYETFDNDFSTFLSKLPNTPLRDVVTNIFNKKLIFFGIAKNVDGTIYSRALISKNEKMAGVVLNSDVLDISLKTGSCPSIDECIYAAYFAIIKAAIVIHKQEIKKDIEFQKNITGFLYVTMLKILGRSISVGSNQKILLQAMCIYLFYRQFFEEKHLKTIKNIHKHYVDIFGKDRLNEIDDIMTKFEPFGSFKEFPKMCQMFGIYEGNSSQLTMQIIRFLDSTGFHTLIGSLETLAASIVLAKYPTEIISRGFSTSNDLHEKIERRVKKYIDQMTYETEFSNINFN